MSNNIEDFDDIQVSALPKKVTDIVTINEDDLETEFSHFAGDYAFWLYNRAKAQTRINSAKLGLDLAKAEARELVKAQSGPSAKLTVEDIKALVSEHPSVVEATQTLHTAEDNEAKINAVVEALRAKKDMLVSLGAHKRALATDA